MKDAAPFALEVALVNAIRIYAEQSGRKIVSIAIPGLPPSRYNPPLMIHGIPISRGEALHVEFKKD